MVKIELNYDGDLEFTATHGPSSKQIRTDAPVDNQGKGSSFSPTDLVATGLGACMGTIMGIVAKRDGIELNGMKVAVEKHMVATPKRRIGKLVVDFDIPVSVDDKMKKKLEVAALTCPVHQSLHPDIEIVANFNWK